MQICIFTVLANNYASMKLVSGVGFHTNVQHINWHPIQLRIKAHGPPLHVLPTFEAVASKKLTVVRQCWLLQYTSSFMGSFHLKKDVFVFS